MAIVREPIFLISGKSRFVSSVSPLLEIIMTTSLRVTCPKSPWMASALCIHKLGVPVDENVEAILRPMIPVLPMPATITRPLHLAIRSTAFTKSRLIRPIKSATALASIAMTSLAFWIVILSFMRSLDDPVDRLQIHE